MLASIGNAGPLGDQDIDWVTHAGRGRVPAVAVLLRDGVVVGQAVGGVNDLFLRWLRTGQGIPRQLTQPNVEGLMHARGKIVTPLLGGDENDPRDEDPQARHYVRIRRLLVRAATAGLVSEVQANEIHVRMTRAGLWDDTLPFPAIGDQ